MMWHVEAFDQVCIYAGTECIAADLPYDMAVQLADTHNLLIQAARYHQNMRWVKGVSRAMGMVVVLIVLLIVI